MRVLERATLRQARGDSTRARHAKPEEGTVEGEYREV